MKLGKKLMVVAMAVATLSMVGCALNQDGEGAIRGKKVDFDNSYVKVIDADNWEVEHVDPSKKGEKDVTVNTTWFYRAVKQLATKHYGATCVITIKPNSKDSEITDGVMGYFIGGKENTAWNNESIDDMDCTLIGVRYCPDDNCLETYISKYEHVSFKEFNFTNLDNLYNVNGVKVGETDKAASEDKKIYSATEKVIVSGSDNSTKCSQSPAYKKINGNFKLKDEDTYKVAVEAIAKDGGAYTINFYNVDENGKKTGNALMTETVSSEVSGYTEKTQTNLGWYANIYPGRHLTGEWEFTDTEGNVIPVE